jgi:hypothetical protein
MVLGFGEHLEVGWVYTARVEAIVVDVVTLWNLANQQLIHDAMRSTHSPMTPALANTRMAGVVH